MIRPKPSCLFSRVMVVVLTLGSLGCSLLKPETAHKHFVFERAWARHTLQNDYLGARLSHIMEPVLFEGAVIAGNEIDGIASYDQKTGQRRWHRTFSGGVTSNAKEKNGVLYFGSGDGFFYALDARTGATRWSFPLRAEGIGAPLVTDDAIYFLAGNNAAYALKLTTGEQIWFYNRIDSANITVRGASEPTLYGQKLLLGFSDGYLVALDKDKGALLWERQLGMTARFRDVDTKPVLDGDRVYVSSYDGQLYCINAGTGQIVWQNEDGGFAPVVISGETLYYTSSTRNVMALEKSSGRVIWSKAIKGTVASAPIVYRGLVIFGEWAGTLRALDMRNGDDVTHFSTGRGVTSAAAIDKATNQLFVMTTDANLFSLRLVLRDQGGLWPWEM